MICHKDLNLQFQVGDDITETEIGSSLNLVWSVPWADYCILCTSQGQKQVLCQNLTGFGYVAESQLPILIPITAGQGLQGKYQILDLKVYNPRIIRSLFSTKLTPGYEMKIYSEMQDVSVYCLQVEETRIINNQPQKVIVPITNTGVGVNGVDHWVPSRDAICAEYIYTLLSPLESNFFQLKIEPQLQL